MLVNGTSQSEIALTNRGLSYGDGLFETILLHKGQPVFLERHLNRLQSGLNRLGISDCISLLRDDIERIRSDFSQYGVLKIIITRGTGGRGYHSKPGVSPDRVLSLHPSPDYGESQPHKGIDAFVNPVRLALQPLTAGLKHLNRLEQVLASNYWPDPIFFESLMLDMKENVTEGTRSNIFTVINGCLLTPALDQCGVQGVMRNYLIEKLGATERGISLPELLSAEEVFFCNSVGGVWPLLSLRTNAGGAEPLRGERHYFQPGEFSRQAQSLFTQALDGAVE